MAWPEKREVASALVHCLVETYLADSASTDPISARLCATWPGVYTPENSASSIAALLLQQGARAAARRGPPGQSG